MLEFAIKLISDSDDDPTDDTSLLLLSLIEVVAEAAFGSDVDRFDGDDTFFATTATNATNAHEATNIIAKFLELFFVSASEFTLPVVLIVLSLSEVTVELESVSLVVGLGPSDGIEEIVNVGSDDTDGSAVGLL